MFQLLYKHIVALQELTQFQFVDNFSKRNQMSIVEHPVKFEYKECAECHEETLVTDMDPYYTELCKYCVKEMEHA
jgi:formylmethanofuran dehydrogenase subunit E